MLNWATRFNIFLFLDNNNYTFEAPAFDWLLAVGCRRSFRFPDKDAFAELEKFHREHHADLFGHLGYNAAGNAYEKDGEASGTDGFGRGFFFEPEHVIRCRHGKVEFDDPAIAAEIESFIQQYESPAAGGTGRTVTPGFTKEVYLRKVRALQAHIQRGDCYEINFCLPFSGNLPGLNLVQLFTELNSLSPAPFAALYRHNNQFCICASPERFLKKVGADLISQPIKGTARRDLADPNLDAANKTALAESAKDRAENIMITDLVRNDLSIVAAKGTVRVKELCGVHSFARVHHLISTVEAQLNPGFGFGAAIVACFPMGSMTGAPKKRVMELISTYEEYQRGLFSGSLGNITAAGDFDFNVVIRSIFYDAETGHTKFFAGSAITAASVPEEEYDECLAKAEAMMSVLQAAETSGNK